MGALEYLLAQDVAACHSDLYRAHLNISIEMPYPGLNQSKNR